MLSPEAQGDPGHFALEGRLASFQRHVANFENNDIKKPFKPSSSVYSLSGNMELGVLDPKLDLYLNPNFFSNSVSTAGLKYQVLGKPRIGSDKGNFSTSIAAGAGRYSGGYNKAAFFQGSDSTPDNIKKMDYSVGQIEVGVISGYRWRSKILHYANFFYTRQTISGEVRTIDNTFNDKRFNTSNTGSSFSTGLIFYFGEYGYVKTDYSYMVSAMQSTRTLATNSASLALGLTF